MDWSVKPPTGLVTQVAAWLIEKLLGPIHMRKLDTLLGKAIRSVAHERFPGEDEFGLATHLEGMLSRILPSGLELVTLNSSRGTALLVLDLVGRAHAEHGDIDPTSLGVSLNEAIGDVLRFFFALLRSEAERSKSPAQGLLFLGRLDGIERRLEAVASMVGVAPQSGVEIERLQILAAGDWIDTCERLYPSYPPIRLFESVWPMAVLPADVTEWMDLESPLGRLVDKDIPLITDYPSYCYPGGASDFETLRIAARTNPKIWNGPTFCLDTLRGDSGKNRIECRTGRYFAMNVTCDSLERELFAALAGRRGQVIDLEEMPRRRWAHEHCNGSDPMLSGLGRSAAVSIATTVLIARSDGGWRVLLAPRSPKVAAHAYFNHVIPSGIFQPLDWHEANLADEYSVELNILREYSEELFDNEELQHGEGFSNDLLALPEVARLLANRDRGRVRMYYTGISLNLLTLRPEICTLILITDPKWLADETSAANAAGRPMRPGWEYLRKADAQLLERNHMLYLDLNEDFAPTHRAGNEAVLPGALVGNAAASMYLAFGVARAVSEAAGPGSAQQPQLL